MPQELSDIKRALGLHADPNNALKFYGTKSHWWYYFGYWDPSNKSGETNQAMSLVTGQHVRGDVVLLASGPTGAESLFDGKLMIPSTIASDILRFENVTSPSADFAEHEQKRFMEKMQMNGQGDMLKGPNAPTGYASVTQEHGATVKKF